ncbi:MULTISPECIES: DUF3828 domain-containing protein [Eikenella]|uniref:DUF3828 domain-containing protein n=1 Tax=Eikenella longinqua TaxID=1795827 RepID=A0A1A9RUA5_9NEIS|nr:MULTISPECIES: DUF3828 domain-containing protein [Eikenella]OAM26619.1 hypothetical protein A7P95_07540 [Eikenella longinqua]
MPKYILAALLAACAATAGADGFRAQKLALVRSLYAPYQNGNALNAHPERHFSADLKAVYQEDQRHTPEGEVGCIDYDPVIAGQDWDRGSLKRTLEIRPLANGRIEAVFQQFPGDTSATQVQFVLQCRPNGRCLIDDIYTATPGNRLVSFKRSVRRCMAKMAGQH